MHPGESPDLFLKTTHTYFLKTTRIYFLKVSHIQPSTFEKIEGQSGVIDREVDSMYRGASPIRNSAPPGLYTKTMHKAIWKP